ITGAKAAAAGPPDSGPDEPILIVPSIGALARSGSTQSSVLTVHPASAPPVPVVAPVPSGGPVLFVVPVAAVVALVAVVFDVAVVPSVPAEVVGAPVPAGASVPAVVSSLPHADA